MPVAADDLPGLESRLSFAFCDRGLLNTALTHRSAGGRHNERLEFLGDALIGFFVAATLFERYPDSREGDLTRLRASLVRRDTLADLARQIGLGDHLRLGSGELKTGGRDRSSILANAFEALVGAIYLDAGYDTCREWLAETYSGRLSGIASGNVTKDSKTRLQEMLQGKALPLPDYRVVRTEGDAHQQCFTVACHVSGLQSPIEGTGSSRRKAEQAAAAKTLRKLDNE